MIARQFTALVFSLTFFFFSIYILAKHNQDVSDEMRKVWLSIQVQGSAIVMVVMTWLLLRPSKEVIGWGLGKEHKAFKYFVIVLSLLALAGGALLAVASKKYGAIHFEATRKSTDLLWLLGVHIVLIGPLLEELIFRGILQGSLEKGYRPATAAVLVALSFALLHNGGGGISVPTIVLGSVALCFLRYKTKVLWPCVLTHMMGNGAIFFYSYFIKFGS